MLEFYYYLNKKLNLQPWSSAMKMRFNIAQF